jgi:cell wall-associated NlpC family hydrolase
VDASGDGRADPFDPVDAIYSAARMYCDERAQLLAAHTPGDLDGLMLAAYNAGIGAVLQCNCIPDYSETQAYVRHVLATEGTMEASLPTGSDLPAPSGTASGAIAFATSKIGTPYEWGGDGSDGRFDCSGLTQAAYASVGVRLPRVANDQYNVGPHPTRDQLEPGDLVFFGTNLTDSRSIDHVGIYIGNGLMVDAPHTGAVVRIEAIAGWPDYFGATRPL